MSVYHCRDCVIDFPCVTSYLKHRKLFCHLGRRAEREETGVDDIGKLSVSEASKRVQEAIQLKIRDYDPQVYNNVEEVLRYKKERRDRALKVNSNRSKVLEIISSLREEKRLLTVRCEEKRKKYESVKAYSKVSCLEVPGLNEMLVDVKDLHHAALFLEDEIRLNVNKLDQVEQGYDLPSLASSQEQSTERMTEHGFITPQLSVLESRENSTSKAPSPAAFVESSFDELDKLKRQRDILCLIKEIHSMEEPPQDSCIQLLSDASLVKYAGEGFVVLLDYLTPTFKIPCVAKVRLYNNTEPISPEMTYMIAPSKDVVPLDLDLTYNNVSCSSEISLLIVISTTSGDEIGWAVFSVFDEESLNVGAWRVSLKVPPFQTELISSRYHGVRSHNYSVRIRCASISFLERLKNTDKLKLPHYKLHTPSFVQISLPITPIIAARKELAPIQKVYDVYGPLDPVSIFGSSGSVTPSKALPYTPTPSIVRSPLRPFPKPAEPIIQTPVTREAVPSPSPQPSQHSRPSSNNINGLHIQHLQSPFDGPIRISIKSWDQETIVVENTFLSTKQSEKSSVKSLFLFSNERIEYPSPPHISVFSILSEEPLGWSYLEYSDKKEKLALFSSPIPNIEDLEEKLSSEEELDYPLLKDWYLTVRHYSKKETSPSYLLPFLNTPELSRPRIPSGALRRCTPEPKFDPPSNEGFIFVIDGARYLPSSVTVTRVCGRIFDKYFNIVGPQISTGVVLETDIYNPLYKFNITIPPDIPNTSIAILKMYTLHINTGKLATVGYSLIPLFCKRGSVTHAEEGDTIALNEGLHQIPIFIEGPDTNEPLQYNTFQSSHVVSCASLLVRIVSNVEEVPLMPLYSDGSYTSPPTQLTRTETFVLDNHRKRPIRRGFDMLETLHAEPSNIVEKLTRHKGQSVNDMLKGDILMYEETVGFGVRVTSILNYTSPDIPLLYFRLCTPTSLHHYDDVITSNSKLVLSTKDVMWNDLTTFFIDRIPNSKLLLLVQVLTFSSNTKQYGTLGWTCGPIFSSIDPIPFLYNDSWNAPLIKGRPNKESLSEIWHTEGSGTSAVIEIFDTRYHSEKKKIDPVFDEDYLIEYQRIVKEGLQHIS